VQIEQQSQQFEQLEVMRKSRLGAANH
jgi:hypothetical protein